MDSLLRSETSRPVRPCYKEKTASGIGIDERDFRYYLVDVSVIMFLSSFLDACACR